jgi:hypothetical protein
MQREKELFTYVVYVKIGYFGMQKYYKKQILLIFQSLEEK